MEGTIRYERILGLAALWRVVVDLDLKSNEVRVRVKHGGVSAWRYPSVGGPCPGYDHTQRSSRHLDTCQMQTIQTADVPRVRCAEHGGRMVRVSCAEPGSRFTALFEAMAIHWRSTG